MRLYVHMMLCGSICTLLYILFNNRLPYELPLKGRRFLIWINIGFYLLPVPWLAAEVIELAQWILEKAGKTFSSNKCGDVYDATSVWNSFIVLDQEGKIVCITGYQRILPVILVIMTVCLALLVGWVAVYVMTGRRYKRNMVFFDAGHYMKGSKEESKECPKWQKKGSLTKRRIVIGISPCVSSPVTVGLVRPVILLPVDYRDYENSMEEVLLHEMNHVSCMDIVERFLGFVVVVMYFFNPLVHYLLRENVAVSEMLSDEAAVKGKTKKQKADYIRCIMAASQKMENPKITVLSLGVSKSLLRKRMEQIMETNKKKRWKKKAAAVVVVVCGLASSIPALAYQKPREYVQNGTNDWSDKDILVFARNGEENPMEGEYTDFGHNNIIFISENDNDYGVMECSFSQGQQGQKQGVCAHSYMTGTIAEHDRHADGSCTVVTYEARQCEKCGNAVRGDEVSSFTYKSCPHIDAGVTEPDQKTVSEMGVVNTDALRVRSAAEYDAAVLTLLKEGAVVTVFEEKGEFYKVLIRSEEAAEPLEGYVRKEYLEVPASEVGIANIDIEVQSSKGATLLKEGKIVRIIAEEGDFYKVLIHSKEYEELLEGYVRKEYLNLFTNAADNSVF